MTEKEHWWREESITVYPKEEDPISEDSKRRILSMRNLNTDSSLSVKSDI